MNADQVVKDFSNEAKKTVEALQRDLTKVRTGRASTAVLDAIQVDYYGSMVPIQQVANVTTPDARTIQIVPWESNMVGAVEKSILAANIGFTPQNDGKIIRISVPALTEDRRKEMVKLVKKMGEESKIGIRNHRRDANEIIKKIEKDKVVSQDEAKKILEKVQKETDQFIVNVDKLLESKEKEIMTV
jgi:ribosome recycling factor